MRITSTFVLLLWLGVAAIAQGQGTAKQDGNRKFQEEYWENHRDGRAALEKGDLTTAEAKFSIARKAAEERGDEKWRELAGVLSFLGTVKKDQNDFGAAEQLYKQSLDIRLRHQRPDEVGVAGAQEDLATLYYVNKQFEKAEPLLSQSIKTYETRLRDTPPPQDQAGIGRTVALGYMALSQIALVGGRVQESKSRCRQALDYAEKWGNPSDKDLVSSRCAGK
jgi:tetratricopeptide (TPR) repeat protein